MTSQSTDPANQAAIEALAARLVQLANAPDESAARAELTTITDQIEALRSQQLEQFSVRTIAAYILALLYRVQDAFPLAMAEARLHGAVDRLTAFVINRARTIFLYSAYVAIHAKRPDIARAELVRVMGALQGTVDLDAERAALDLLSHIETINVSREGRRPLDGRPSLLKIGVWGDRFIEAAERNVLSSLLAPGNAAALAEFGPLIVHIHTRRRDADRLRALAPVRELERHGRVEVEVMPEEFFVAAETLDTGVWSRNLLAMVEYDSLMYARQIGADMFCLGADMVLSEGCLKAAKDKLAGGYDIVLMSPLRATEQTMSPLLAGYRQGAALSVPADALYRLSLENLHPSTHLQFMRQPPQKMGADPHQVFFPEADGFCARAIQWHPFAFSARAVPEDIGFDCHTIDCRFASDLTRGKDRDAACYLQRHPPEDGYMVSLDSHQGIAEFGTFEVSPAGVATSLAHWISLPEDFDYFTWVLRQRAMYRLPPGVTLDLPQDGLDEDQAILETIAAIERQRAEISRRLAQYAR